MAGSDLVAFLNARLGEDEDEAKATADADAELWAGVSGDGTHFARHDPARGLREAEAQREIIVLHGITGAKVAQTPFGPYTGEGLPDEFELLCAGCGNAGADVG